MATERNLDETIDYIKGTIKNWEDNAEFEKLTALAVYVEKKDNNIGGPAAKIKALNKNINSSKLKLKRNIFSSPKAKSNLEEELKWSREELARLQSTYVPKTRKPTEK
jgi:hypothetical protein